MMPDFQKIEEMTFLVMELDQVIMFDNGIMVNKDNFAEFITSLFDA